MDVPSSTPKVPDVKKIFTDSGFHNLANLVDYFEKDKNTVELTLLITQKPTKTTSLAPALGLGNRRFTFGSKTGEITPFDTLQLIAEIVESLGDGEESVFHRAGILKLDAAVDEFLRFEKRLENPEHIENFDD